MNISTQSKSSEGMRWHRILIMNGLVLAACGNEPYDTGSIHIISINDKKGGLAQTYQYRQKRLYIWKATRAGAVIGESKFSYAGENLSRIVTDSTATSYRVTDVVADGGRIVLDSTYLVTENGAMLVARRDYSYDDNGRLSLITQVDWTDSASADSAPTETGYEYTWDGGNLALTRIIRHAAGAVEVLDSVSVEYDDRPNTFGSDRLFLFTIPLSELYYLSNNNPLTVRRLGKEEEKYKYIYNKFRYPASYTKSSDTGAQFALSYTELK